MKGKTVGTVLYILFSLIILALFEFNKNTLAGWAVAVVLLVLYPVVRSRKPFKNKKGRESPLKTKSFCGYRCFCFSAQRWALPLNSPKVPLSSETPSRGITAA